MAGMRRFAMVVLVMLGAVWTLPMLAQQGQALPSKYNVQFFALQVEKQDLRMAYRDVAAYRGLPTERQWCCCMEKISRASTGSPRLNSWRGKGIA